MKPDYLDAFFNDYLERSKDCPVKLDVIKMKSKSMTEGVEEYEDKHFPVASVCFESEYITDDSIKTYRVIDQSGVESEEEVSLEKVLPLSAKIKMAIVSTDSDHIVSSEDYIQRLYSSGITISTPTIESENKMVCFEIRLDMSKTKRERKGDLLTSTMILCCTGCVTIVEHVHPAKVAFDDQLRLDILNQVVALNDISRNLEDRLPFYAFVEDDYGRVLSEEEIEIQKKSIHAKEVAESLRSSTMVVPDEFSDPFFINKVLEYVKQNGCSVQDSIDYFSGNNGDIEKEKERFYKTKKNRIEKQKTDDKKQKEDEERARIKKEKARKEREEAEVYLQSRGDPETNRYIDAAIEDLRKRINTDVTIYGGSTYMDYVRDKMDRNLKYPFVLVLPDVCFSLKYNTYYVWKDGVTEQKYVDFQTSFPWSFGLKVQVHQPILKTEIREKASELEQSILKEYEKGIDLWVRVLNTENMFTHVFLKGKKTAPPAIKKSYDGIDDMRETMARIGQKILEISFEPSESVYFAYDYDPETLSNNARLQCELIRRLDMLQNVCTHYEKAITDAQKLFPACFGHKVTIGILDVQQKELKRLFDNHQYITRQQFYKAFPSISLIFPSVYDRFYECRSLDQILEEMHYIRDYNVKQYNMIFQDLNLKDEYRSEYYYVFPKTKKGLLFLKLLIDEKEMPLNDAVIIKYLKEMDDKKKEALKPKQKTVFDFTPRSTYSSGNSSYNNSYEDDYEPRRSSSSRGFFGDVATTAMGVAIGNTISDYRHDKKEKKRRAEEEEKRRREEETREMRERMEKWHRENEEKWERERQQKKEAEERKRRYDEALEAYRNVERVNYERRRKGLTPLPLPPRPRY